MTFCFAWKMNNDIFIVGDSLITLNNSESISEGCTSFGESYSLSESPTLEKSLKLCQIDNSIVAYAGDVNSALKILNDFKEYRNEEYEDIQNLKDSVISEIMPGESVEFLIGYLDEDKSAKLYKIIANSSEDIAINEVEEKDYIGIKIKEYSQIIEAYNYSKNRMKESSKVLIFFLTILQRITSFVSLEMENGIGGAFKGLMINNGIIKWNDSIKYIFYVPENDEIKLIQDIGIFIFDGGITIGSKPSNECKLIANPINYKTKFHYPGESEIPGYATEVMIGGKKYARGFPAEGRDLKNEIFLKKILEDLKFEIIKKVIGDRYRHFVDNEFYDYYIFINLKDKNAVLVNYKMGNNNKFIRMTKDTREEKLVWTKLEYYEFFKEFLLNKRKINIDGIEKFANERDVIFLY